MKSILLLLIITLLGCSSNMKQEPISKSGIPVINLSEDVSTVPSLLLSESAEKLEIVSLEMTDQSMLGEIRRIQVTEHDIWIHDFNKFYIYRFSRTGKFLNRIGSIGQAPGEYVNFSTFLVDEYKKEVYIISNNNGILVYNFKGEFKKKIVDQVIRRIVIAINCISIWIFKGQLIIVSVYTGLIFHPKINHSTFIDTVSYNLLFSTHMCWILK